MAGDAKGSRVFPAEWERHCRTVMQWPVYHKNGDIEDMRRCYASVARAIARFEPVAMIARPDLAEGARRLCGGDADVEVLPIPHDDAWARDSVATFVRLSAEAGAGSEAGVATKAGAGSGGGGSDRGRGGIAAVNWKFNAWGEKYPDWALDDAVTERLCSLWGMERIDAPLVLEGGSIHTNGAGVLLTTSECLLNPNRNPGMPRGEIEAALARHLGQERVVWLPYGLCGDDTDGHVDNVCCFVGESTVLMQWTDDRGDENRARYEADYEVLAESGFAVEKILQPPPLYLGETRLAASYVNFVFANGGIVMPAFGGIAEEADAAALQKMRGLFPRREVVAVKSLEMLKDGGNIHCATQQVPG
ncbi:MAG: agmatine deiminase family protein [Clostridiales bacterium]|jgi:agmatine deiminase|nr:agmatine deiminase family protein [Clostridiales bacterium]